MRLIDAEALKKQIKDFRCKGCDNYNFVRCRACWVDDTLSYLDEATTVGGWVSIKDHMPDEEEIVIVLVMHKIGWYMVFAWYDGNRWNSSMEGFAECESDYVTYWMQLPSVDDMNVGRYQCKIVKAPTVAKDKNVPDNWISVKDRLPDKNGEYIVFDGEDVYSAMYKRGRKKSEWTDFDEEYLNLDITHWMPLPEPPKESNNERDA